MQCDFFFFNDTATTEIYTLSLHDALPIYCRERTETNPIRVLDCKNPGCQQVAAGAPKMGQFLCAPCREHFDGLRAADRKSTRLNSSHSQISYAVFCLNKKNHSTRAQMDYL